MGDAMKQKQETALFKAGNVVLRKKANRHDYTNAKWRKTSGPKAGRVYVITKRVADGLFLIWDAYGAYPPPGVSVKITVMDLVKNYELVR